MKDLCIRTKKLAMFLIEQNSTVRETAKVFGISKSTVHYDLTKRLPKYDLYLYEKVRQILDLNFEEKNIRGGISTREKYKKVIVNWYNFLLRNCLKYFCKDIEKKVFNNLWYIQKK